MADEAPVSIEELQSNLEEYTGQLKQVIELTRDLLKDALEMAAPDPAPSYMKEPVQALAGPSSSAPQFAQLATSLLPASVAEKYKRVPPSNVLPSNVRPQPETAEVYQGVAAPKRKRVDDQPVVTEIPKWLAIKEEDDEKDKSFERRGGGGGGEWGGIKTKEKQDNWRNFLSGKGKKKKPGFITGVKKESIFKVPDNINAKVGVVGSGGGLTEFGKRTKHLNAGDDEE
eukprot:gene24528-10133_t